MHSISHIYIESSYIKMLFSNALVCTLLIISGSPCPSENLFTPRALIGHVLRL
uniref:Uncharacterized protein n=1 Tax=Anguilla anguilla TaxID=7936 RepID=A0A0E9PYV4_ANGAN